MRLWATKSVVAPIFMGKAKRMAEFMDSDCSYTIFPMSREATPLKVRWNISPIRTGFTPTVKGEVEYHPTCLSAQRFPYSANRRINVLYRNSNGLSLLGKTSA
jgi:hypothetical protein